MDILSCQTNPHQSIIGEGSQIQLCKNPKRDEYPLIWYDPYIDSEEKETLKWLIQENTEINLFSKLEEAFLLAKKFGSFLLIAPMEIDEKKLLQEFGELEDTYGRRYFDFEEKAVLLSLFKEISEDRIKSLKVYVFCTREDFLKIAPINEEEEEIVVKCGLKEMADQFREEFTILWYDPDLSPERKELIINKLDIEEKNIFKDFYDLQRKLDSETALPYHLILSGKTKIDVIIEKVDDLKGLLCIYLYESHYLVVNEKKRRRIIIEKTLKELIPRIIEGIRTNLKYKNTFPAFATQFDDWDKSHINKVHYYLRGFINFKNRRQAKGDFLSLAKRIYQSRKILRFEKEYVEYNREQILKWYAEQSPIYKLINNCLRISTSDSILYCRFILKDMERAIREEYQQSQKYNGVVYRGAFMTKDEFEKLERNVGKEIEMYGFLSTSRNLETAEKFLNDDIANKVLIKIIIPPLPLPELDEQGFADLSKLSKFPQEEEILFNVRSRFQVFEVGNVKLSKNGRECRYLVLLYGAHLLRRCMTIENPRISLEFELPLELKCNDCESKNDLFAYTEERRKTQMICRKCLTPINSIPKEKTFLLPIHEKNQFSREKRIQIELKGRMLELGIEAKLTCVKTDKCHQCSMVGKKFYKRINLEDQNIVLSCSKCLKENQESQINYLYLFEGSTQVFWGSKQGKWEEIEMNWKVKEFKEIETQCGAHIFKKAHDNGKCQEFCRTALQSSVRKMGRERVKVVIYWKLGKSCQKLGEHQNALDYYLAILEILKSVFGESHPDIATSYHHLASVYKSLRDYGNAFNYYLKALTIRKSVSGEAHPKTITSYNNLASVYESLGNSQEAFKYHLKALVISKSVDEKIHPKITVLYQNLEFVYQSFEGFQNGLEYYLKTLEFRKFIYGEAHPETAVSYNNLASVSKSLGDYQNALGYYLKALKTQKFIYGRAHPENEILYNNLASVSKSLGDYQKVLGYYLKALKTQKFIYGEAHPKTITSYNNLASVYDSLGDNEKVLECDLKSQNIQKFQAFERDYERGFKSCWDR